jgi:hypothetical protein
VHYWNGIEKALCDLGAKVIVTRVPKTETISNRAYALHSILTSFMADKELNLIAHSMVGKHTLTHTKEKKGNVTDFSFVVGWIGLPTFAIAYETSLLQGVFVVNCLHSSSWLSCDGLVSR